MASELVKEAYTVVAANRGSVTDAGIVALIEIREAIEANTEVLRDLVQEKKAHREDAMGLLQKFITETHEIFGDGEIPS